MRGLATALAVAVTLGAAPAATAGEWWKDEHGGSLEGSVFYKSFLMGAKLPGGLVDGLDAVQARLDEAKALLPPGSTVDLPPVALPPEAVLNAHLARVSTTFRFEDKLTFDFAWQASLTVASHESFVTGASLTQAVGGASGTGPRRRLVDLDPLLFERDGLRAEHLIDRLSVKLPLPFGDLTVGRQTLSWGTGRLWNPTDLLSPFPPTVIDREVRRGFDAVRLAVALGDVTQLDLLYLPQQEAWDTGAAVRFQTNVKEWDASVSVAKYDRDLVVGADTVGDLGPFGVHAEAAYTWALGGLGERGAQVKVSEQYLRAVAGLDWKPHDDVLVMAEYHYNGVGALKASDYAKVLQSKRAQRGEVFGAARHYAGLVVAWTASDLVSVSGAALVNLQDPSAMLVPSVEWWFEQNVIVRAGGYIPLGAQPDPTALQQLTLADEVFQSPAFERATSSLGFKSEHGASPFGVFLQVGLYLP